MKTIETKYFVITYSDAEQGTPDRKYITKEEFESVSKTFKYQGDDVYVYKEEIVSLITQMFRNGKR